MPSASVLKLEQILLVTFQDESATDDADGLLTRVGDSVATHSARGVLVDVSALSIVDTYMARTLAGLVGMTRLLGADAIIAGVRPEVAITMVELGVDLPDIATALNVDDGLNALRRRIGSRG